MEQVVIPDAGAAKQLLKKACEDAEKSFSPNSGETKPIQENPNTATLPNPCWKQRVIRLTPTEKLKKLVEASDKLTAEAPTEEQEAAGAGNPS